MSEAKDRLLNKGLYTTILGILCLVLCGLMMYTEKATTMELAGFFGLGLALLRSKDSLIGIKETPNDTGDKK
jgi:hypothetical protein